MARIEIPSKRSVAASDTWSGFILHLPLDYRTQRQSTTLVWPLAYLLAMAAGKFGPGRFLWSKTHLEFETHCQRQAIRLVPSVEFRSEGERESSGHLVFPRPPSPTPIPPPLVVRQTHYVDIVHRPCGTDWDLVDGEFLLLPFQSPSSFACQGKTVLNGTK